MSYKTRIALTHEDIAALESQFCLKLPADYIYCMQHYPAFIFEHNKKVYLDENLGLGDPAFVIRIGDLNMNANLEILMALNASPRHLPEDDDTKNKNLFIIGENGPWRLFINVTEEHPKVYSYYNIEDDQAEVYAESLQDVMKFIISRDEYKAELHID